MVKTPPCSKYEPPRNILYSRNGKKFCRISTKGNPNGPQVPPCEQYGKNYVIYKKNNKEFCRKSNKKSKIIEKKTLKKKNCYQISDIKLKKFANLLNINLSKYSDKDWICNSMENLFDTSIPDISDIKYLCQLFKIKTNGKRESILCNEIREKSMKNKDFKEIVSIINSNNSKGEELDYLVSNILISSLFPYNFPHKSPIPISENLYSELIQKKSAKEFLTKDEEELLNNSLYIKLCHCTKKLFLKSKFIKNIFNKKNDINTYAICTSSVYNNRGLKAPPSATRNCQKNFKWLRGLSSKKKQKGGSKSCSIAHIGADPPNKEIIKNNDITSCFNSFETHTPPTWPNIYACPSKKCNYWAGGKISLKKKKIKNKKSKKGGRINKCNLNNVDIINVTNNSLEKYARPSNSGKYNQLDYASKIAKNFQNGNNNNWNSWIKSHDNYWW